MNSRLFLYSSLFFVLILLFDASSRPTGESLNNIKNEKSMPETTENSVSTSEQFPEVMGNDSKQAQPRSKHVDVITDTHKLKISLTDGSIVSAELLNYAKEFESTDSNVKLLNNCLLYTSPSPRDGLLSRMPSSA